MEDVARGIVWDERRSFLACVMFLLLDLSMGIDGVYHIHEFIMNPVSPDQAV